MKEDKMIYVLSIIAVILLASLSFALIMDHNSKHHPDTPDMDENVIKSEYCVEWAGQVDRTTLSVICVDYANKELLCSWNIDEFNRLTIWTEGDEENADYYECTQFIDSYVVLPPVE